jgi:catechol 2,3-dioxygenase-like lactoylglutathione lyase family enzyme
MIRRMPEDAMQHEVHQLLSLYERRSISRRALVEGLAALVLGSRIFGQTTSGTAQEPLIRARTLNHVTIITADVARSKAFYQRVTGLAVRDEGKDFCEFRLEGSFLGLYAPEAGHQRLGFDHFCFGIEAYDAKRVLGELERAIPEAHPTLEYGDQVYVRDPDGVRVQFADVSYKR